MSNIISFAKTTGAAAAVALALSLGALTPAGAYTYASFEPIASHEQWRSFSVRVDDVPAAGALTLVGKERIAAVLLLNHHIVLTLSAQSWNLKPKDEITVDFTIQDKKFAIKAHVASEHELSLDVPGNDDFIHQLTHADEMIVHVQGEQWKLGLGGFDNSIAEALGAMKKIDASL